MGLSPRASVRSRSAVGSTMVGLGLAASNPISLLRRPSASPRRASLHPRGLDVDTKFCVRCGAAYFRPSDKGGIWWRNRRYCTARCYQAREPRPLAERFWRYVRKGPGCWEWTAARGGSGYGTFGLTRETMTPAHRFSWELHFGPIPAGMLVCHHCDNPPCVRPDHLFLGTHLANMRDMDRKGRRRTSPRPGEQNPNARLTEGQVREIRVRRAMGETCRALAAEFGVSQPLISYIFHRKSWAHVV